MKSLPAQPMPQESPGYWNPDAEEPYYEEAANQPGQSDIITFPLNSIFINLYTKALKSLHVI